MTAILRSGSAFLFMVTFLTGCGGFSFPPTVEINNFSDIAGKYYSFSEDTLVINKNGSYHFQKENKTITGKLKLKDGEIEGVRKDGNTFMVTAYKCEGVRILETYSYVEKKGKDPVDEFRDYYQSDGPISRNCNVRFIRALRSAAIGAAAMGPVTGGHFVPLPTSVGQQIKREVSRSKLLALIETEAEFSRQIRNISYRDGKGNVGVRV